MCKGTEFVRKGAMDNGILKREIYECEKRAVETGTVQYLYHDERGGAFISTNTYIGSDYLFCAYPDGRKIVSRKCKEMLEA